MREPTGASNGDGAGMATGSSTYHFYDAGTDAGKKKRKGAATADEEEEDEPPEKRKAKGKGTTQNGNKSEGASCPVSPPPIAVSKSPWKSCGDTNAFDTD